MDHVWRVFENGKEFLLKNLDITAPVKSEKDVNGMDYNIVCQGYMTLDRERSKGVITQEKSETNVDPMSNLFAANA